MIAPDPASSCPCCGAPVAPRDIHIDAGRGMIVHRETSVHLTAQQMRVFAALWSAFPRVVTRETLLAAAADPAMSDAGSDSGLVGVLIHNIRPRLAALGIGVETSVGIGYALAIDAGTAAARKRQRGEVRPAGGAIETLLKVAVLRMQRLPVSEIARRTGLGTSAVIAAMDDLNERARPSADGGSKGVGGRRSAA